MVVDWWLGFEQETSCSGFYCLVAVCEAKLKLLGPAAVAESMTVRSRGWSTSGLRAQCHDWE